MKKEKYYYLEALRIFAVLFVIFNHTGNHGYFLFADYPTDHFLFWFYASFAVICRTVIPLFFMISGALLIQREIDLKKHLAKILRFGLILLVFSIIYYIYLVYAGLEIFSLKRFILVLYESYWVTPLWYLYAYLAFLVALPFIRKLALSLTNREYLYWMFLALILQSLLPMLEYLVFQGTHFINFDVNFLFVNILFYPCLGYFIAHRLEPALLTKKNCRISLGLSGLCVLLSIAMTVYLVLGHNGECSEATSQAFLGSFAWFIAMTLFANARFLFQNYHFSKRTLHRIEFIGSLCFGIYLWHALVMYFVNDLWNVLPRNLISAWLYCLLVFMISAVITLAVKKLPIVNKLN